MIQHDSDKGHKLARYQLLFALENNVWNGLEDAEAMEHSIGMLSRVSREIKFLCKLFKDLHHGYKSFTGCKPHFLLFFCTSVCCSLYQQKTNLSCRYNWRLNGTRSRHKALSTACRSRMVMWPVLQNCQMGRNWRVWLPEKQWYLFIMGLYMYVNMPPTVRPTYRWLQATLTYQEAALWGRRSLHLPWNCVFHPPHMLGSRNLVEVAWLTPAEWLV